MYNIYTIDVEAHKGTDPVNRQIYGITKDNRVCGIDMIMDYLDKYSIKGVFFVDVAEAWDYGEQKIAGVLEHIKNRGHDVGVHIHPDHMADKNRSFLWEYNRDEQYAIISKCTDLYNKVLGEPPLAFRAGKYGANSETLEILSELGYKLDFSQFYGQKWCRIDLPTKMCAHELENGLIEIPVTVFVSIQNKFYSRSDKIDCSQTFSEFKRVYETLDNDDERIIVLFAHSFSLIDWRLLPNSPRYSKNQMKRFESQLKYLQDQGDTIKNIGIQEAIELFCIEGNRSVNDEIPVMRGIVPYVALADRLRIVLKSKIDNRVYRLLTGQNK